MEANGLKDVKVTFSSKALLLVIHRYTREAGVRALEREIASLCRKVAKRVLKEGKEGPYKVTMKKVIRYLGPPRYEYGSADKKDQIGLVNGLVWSRTGGDTLPIEVAVMPGKGKLILTGKLGDVMKESAHAAMSYVRSRADRFGIDHKVFENNDLHMHFPETSIGKDGPSAGLGMTLALVSALTKIPVKQGLAITGEINLRGSAMTIGGLKEKAIGAHRAGIKTILIPKGNERHIRDIPRKVREALTIIPVEHMDEVLKLALVLDDPEKFFKGLEAARPALPEAAPAAPAVVPAVVPAQA
jgi:ATP-dependent Lon protease